jgi:hypothetical protein
MVRSLDEAAMTIKEMRKLHPGDQVFWEDPDGGACSRVLRIQTIKVVGNVATIMELDGSILECYAKELKSGL